MTVICVEDLRGETLRFVWAFLRSAERSGTCARGAVCAYNYEGIEFLRGERKRERERRTRGEPFFIGDLNKSRMSMQRPDATSPGRTEHASLRPDPVKDGRIEEGML